MIGIDIVSVSRIEKNITRYGKGFLQKFLLPTEIALVVDEKGFKIPTIAGFWAAKEACSKALGTGISKELRFFDMEILKNHKNAPYIKISKKSFNIKNIALSISHDGGFSIAVVIINH